MKKAKGYPAAQKMIAKQGASSSPLTAKKGAEIISTVMKATRATERKKGK